MSICASLNLQCQFCLAFAPRSVMLCCRGTTVSLSLYWSSPDLVVCCPELFFWLKGIAVKTASGTAHGLGSAVALNSASRRCWSAERAELPARSRSPEPWALSHAGPAAAPGPCPAPGPPMAAPGCSCGAAVPACAARGTCASPQRWGDGVGTVVAVVFGCFI